MDNFQKEVFGKGIFQSLYFYISIRNYYYNHVKIRKSRVIFQAKKTEIILFEFRNRLNLIIKNRIVKNKFSKERHGNH